MPDSEVQCTYGNCDRTFVSIQAMQRHKARDGVHDYYCKRCDIDCEDDTALFYHQITSPKHICCPVCAKDFRSQGGRDRHVEIDHIPKQQINCAGCDKHFSSASGLMRHIEENECEVIKKIHFQRQRAERQILKEAWQSAANPTAGMTTISDINPDTNNEQYRNMTLMDDERAWVQTDWQGDPMTNHPEPSLCSSTNELNKSLSQFALNRILPLDTLSTRVARPIAEEYNSNTDLLDLNQKPQVGVVANRLAKSPTPASNRAALLRWQNITALKQNGTIAPEYTQNSSNQGKSKQQTIPHGVAASNVAQSEVTYKVVQQAGANANQHITTVTQIQLPANIDCDRYWDPILEIYTCPGQKCRQRFNDPTTFKAHLITNAHVMEFVNCPGCHRRFRTTAALLAHFESGSRRCTIRHALDLNKIVKEVTAGMMSADGYQEDGSIRYTAEKIEDW